MSDCRPRPLKPHLMAKWRAWCKNPDDFHVVIAPPLVEAAPASPSREDRALDRRGRFHVVRKREVTA